jgi:hypothetical protein
MITLKNIRGEKIAGDLIQIDSIPHDVDIDMDNIEGTDVGGRLIRISYSEIRARVGVPTEISDAELQRALDTIRAEPIEKARDAILFGFDWLGRFADASEVVDRLLALREWVVGLISS